MPQVVEPRTCNTARERELLEGTEQVRPVDFHSWRRMFNQALANAGVNLQQAQALAGHSSLEAHQRYLTNTSIMRRMPIAALPALAVQALPVPKLPSSATQSSSFPVRPARFEPATFGSGGQGNLGASAGKGDG
jgi:hypothetical protein